MKALKFAVFGAGFWSNFQIAGWKELEGLQLMAICDPDQEKCRTMAEKFGIPGIYSDAETMLDKESLDFVDIIASVESHLPLAKMAAENGLHVVCQKPMAPSLAACREMVAVCKRNGVRLFINENFRWQAPVRKVKQLLESGVVGKPFKGRVTFCSAFPVFDNQPALRQLDRFIITDIGSHILDICRFLFGEALNLRCLTHRVNPKIKGEDVATVLMEMTEGIHCYAEMSYASRLAREAFPETLLLIEAEKGSIELAPDMTIKITNAGGTTIENVEQRFYPWADPQYALVHNSIVDTQANLLEGLRGENAETTGDDNYQTSRLIWACYHSAEHKKLVSMDEFHGHE
jgi:predicted dehydrogenase